MHAIMIMVILVAVDVNGVRSSCEKRSKSGCVADVQEGEIPNAGQS
jgi:hypothetical protein